MNYIDNPIKGNFARLEQSADYYGKVSVMLEHALDITSYIWCEHNKSASVEVLRVKFDGILDKIVYAARYYSEVCQTLRRYVGVLRRYYNIAEQLVGEHNALVKRQSGLDTEQVYVSLGMMQATKTDPQMRLERLVREFDHEANQIAHQLEQRVFSYLDNAQMRDSFFEDIADMFKGFVGFLRGR
jgi:hypothetical protein